MVRKGIAPEGLACQEEGPNRSSKRPGINNMVWLTVQSEVK